jgi:hypothetical protein
MKKPILTYEQFLIERSNVNIQDSQLILEGGAAGHMKHPFDDQSLTFGDFKKIPSGAVRPVGGT